MRGFWLRHDLAQGLRAKKLPPVVPAAVSFAKGFSILVSQKKRQRSIQKDADRFVDLVNGSGFWKSIDLRFCAIRSGRCWENLVSRGFLDHRAPPSIPKFCSVDRQYFRAWQVVRPIVELPDVVRGIVSGRVKLKRRSVGYILNCYRQTSHQTEMEGLWNAATVDVHTIAAVR